MVHQSLEIHDKQAGRLFRRLESFLGIDRVEARLARIDSELRIEKGIYREYWVLPNRKWWWGFGRALQLQKSGKSLRGNLEQDMFAPLRAAKEIDLLYGSMSDAKKREFRSRILAADNLNPVLLELEVAAHLRLLGYGLDWSETGAANLDPAPELIARRGEVDLEVECKTKGVDAGRRITRRTFYRLADRIVTLLRKSRLMGEFTITTPGRLPAEQGWHDQVLSSVSENLSSPKGRFNLDDGTELDLNLREYTDLLLPPASVLSTANEARKPYSHIAVSADKGNGGVRNPITFKIESYAPDRYLDDVLEDLRKANRQLSGDRTGMIICYVPEVESFEGLGEDSALKNMTAHFFTQHARESVCSVIYSSDEVQGGIAGVVSSHSPAISFDNPNYDPSLGPCPSILNPVSK